VEKQKDIVSTSLLEVEECQEFFPTYHLVIYFHFARFKGGNLFPDVEEINNPPFK